MKHIIRFLCVSFLFIATLSQAATFDKIIVFGDSLSDNGNLYSVTSKMHQINNAVQIMPASPPYFKGRFSNGLVWVEDLAAALHLDTLNTNQFEDYAYGGAWAESSSFSHQQFPPDLAEEVTDYQFRNVLDFSRDNHLYIIWDGANDYLGGRTGIESAVSNTISDLQWAIERLLLGGAKTIMVPNLPDLGRTPFGKSQSPAMSMELTQLSKEHNKELDAMLTKLRKAYPDAKLVSLNIYDYFHDILAHPHRYGLHNVKRPCLTGGYAMTNMTSLQPQMDALQVFHINAANNPDLRVALSVANQQPFQLSVCKDPGGFLFWDRLHPTAAAHQIIADHAAQLLLKG